MYCRNCGTQIKDNDKFCIVCGKEVNASPSKLGIMNKATQLLKNASKKQIIAVCCGAAAIILAVVLICVLGCSSKGQNGPVGTGKSSMEEAVEAYVEACVNGDAQAVADLHNPEVIEAGLEMTGADLDELVEDADIEFGSLRAMKGTDYEIELTEITEADSGQRLSMKSMFRRYYGIDNLEDAVFVDFEVKFKDVPEGEDDTESGEVPVVKVGGLWYIWSVS